MLDAKNDKYYLIEKTDWRYASRVIEQVPTLHVEDNSEIDQNIFETVQAMARSGLLTTDCLRGKPIIKCDVKPPSSLFEQLESDLPPDIRWFQPFFMFIVGFFVHCLLVAVPLRIIIKMVGKRGQDRVANIDDYIAIARAFQHLRPFLPKSRICLYDSLAFYFFSRLHGLRPDLVIGVRAEPFSAHCWAQIDGTILNDVPANILQYKPIMLI